MRKQIIILPACECSVAVETGNFIGFTPTPPTLLNNRDANGCQQYQTSCSCAAQQCTIRFFDTISGLGNEVRNHAFTGTASITISCGPDPLAPYAGTYASPSGSSTIPPFTSATCG
ncbi:unnamed protein product [Enterobius vermicularis]|uniref:Phlebovirus glycoprotein G2 fusion domain-containing protein n=1 Tax=Enterobius vermicularis TaxID=51028 RepID=A0A0N4VL86_ENTVE|nr:unnamed protein product [Enterobius vermicularis]